MKTILFPTDFTAVAENAFNYAIGLSRKIKAKLILIHSFHVPAYQGNNLDEDAEGKLFSLAENEINKLKSKALLQEKNLDVEGLINYGFAVDRIISNAVEKDANLIVLGTKSESSMKEASIASNVAPILEKAPCPVLVIPEKARFRTLGKIVFATDFRDDDFHSIAALAGIAQLFNAEIMIVHVSEVAPTGDHESTLLQWYKDELMKRENIEYENISFHNLVGGNVDYELEDFIEKNNIDMLALSMRVRSVFSKLFEKGLTKKMMYHSHTPLLVFHASKKMT